MALAQETRYLLLDEPTTYLDMAHQLDVMDLITRLNRQLGKTVVLVLHDLNLAAGYADHIVVLDWGQIVAQGSPTEVLTPEMLWTVFRIDARVFRDDKSGGRFMCSCANRRTGRLPR